MHVVMLRAWFTHASIFVRRRAAPAGGAAPRLVAPSPSVRVSPKTLTIRTKARLIAHPPVPRAAPSAACSPGTSVRVPWGLRFSGQR